MKRRTLLWGLAAVNALLLVVLMWKLGVDNPAQAQAMPRGNFIMVPADVPGATAGVIYIVDTSNGILGGFYLTQRGLEVMPPLPFARLMTAGPPRR